MKMKNDNEKTKHNPPKAKEFFSQFSKKDLLKIRALADVIKYELEVTKKYTNKEKEWDRSELSEMAGEDEPIKPIPYENSDYVLTINFGRVSINITPYEFENFLQRIGDAFRFFDPATTSYSPTNKDENYYIGITSKDNFDFFYEQLGKLTDKFVKNRNKNYAEIYYQKAGIGTINRSDFKLHTKEKRRVFEELYLHMSEPIPRQRVLKLIGFYDEDEIPNTAYRANETYKINQLVKELRGDTGLNPRQLVNNNGDLTLIGKRVEPTE